ncbi:MAG TPA: protein kinase [Stellaceae bacterium]|nr:protein kinase [Stellaceae bacterium]
MNDTYIIERCLGKGGMGEVYEAKHIELGSKRAIKIILPEYAKNTQYVGLFIEEARKLSRVTNDAIVRYFEFSRDETGARYLVMEFVDGESLSAVLDRRCLTPAEVIELIVRLAQGLAAAYDQGIKAHRDISPANILLPQGRVDLAKVIDFGIAKSADGGMTLIGSDFAGKYSYVSPEQVGLFGGPEQVDEKSDIYSLGLLAAAAAIGFGKRLDMGSEPASVTLARQKVPDLSGIPGELRPLLSRMLQPRPQDRPSSMRALIEEAQRLGPKQAERPGAAGARPKRRLPVWQLASGLVGLAAVAGVAIFMLWPKPPATPTVLATPEPPLKPPVALQPPVPVPPPNQQATLPPPAPAPVNPTESALAELSDTMKTLDCASLRSETSPRGVSQIAGNVASADDQARLVAIAAKLPSDQRPELRVEIIPPPLCRSIHDFADLQTDGLLTAGGVELKMAQATTLHTGDPIAVDVKSLSAVPMNLRIDYFTLTGDVLHMWPNADLPTATLAAGEARKFLNSAPGNKVWQVGGAPFGTEYITVIATAQPLGGDMTVRAVEPAADYLRELKDALRHAAAPAGQPNFVATVFVHTAEK